MSQCRARLARGAGAALTAACALLPALASATDGVAEISQTCAVQTGCFPGDPPGYPVTIDGSAGESYRLTSSLAVPDENTVGILVSAPRIAIDLNGFEIVRAACAKETSGCVPRVGTGSGVDATSMTGLVVRNGAVTGTGGNGVVAGGDAQISGLRVRWNRLNGISVGSGSTVSGNTAHNNGSNGINAGTGSAVSDNRAHNNGALGIFAGVGATVSGNTAYDNGTNGISTGSGSILSGNATYSNAQHGIVAASGSTVSGNNTYNNGGIGIIANDGSTVQHNTTRGNGSVGLNLGATTAYRGNVVTGNTLGTVSGGVNLGANSCNGIPTCP